MADLSRQSSGCKLITIRKEVVKMKKFIKNDTGVVIVEATLIFPLVFLIVFLMVFTGNAYFQKSRVEGIVAKMTYYGAAQCADPLLKEVVDKGASGLSSDYEIQPYRYFLGEVGSGGGMNKIESSVKDQITQKINNMDTGVFSGMKPKIISVDCEYNNFFVYSTFCCEVSCEIKLPMKLPGMRKNISFTTSCRYDVPVSDVPEFIRNVNMVQDWLETSKAATEALGKIDEIMGKVSEWIN